MLVASFALQHLHSDADAGICRIASGHYVGLQPPHCSPAQKLQTRHVATVQTPSSETRTCSCRFCGAAFQSKNALTAIPTPARVDDAAALWRRRSSGGPARGGPRAPPIAERKQHVATYLVGYGAGRGADAEAALTSLCSASSVTRATAVAARGRSAALALGDAAAARDVLSVVSDHALPAARTTEQGPPIRHSRPKLEAGPRPRGELGDAARLPLPAAPVLARGSRARRGGTRGGRHGGRGRPENLACGGPRTPPAAGISLRT